MIRLNQTYITFCTVGVIALFHSPSDTGGQGRTNGTEEEQKLVKLIQNATSSFGPFPAKFQIMIFLHLPFHSPRLKEHSSRYNPSCGSLKEQLAPTRYRVALRSSRQDGPKLNVGHNIELKSL